MSSGWDDDVLEDVCGISYDHSLSEAECRDGECSAVCLVCGAELMWEEEQE